MFQPATPQPGRHRPPAIRAGAVVVVLMGTAGAFAQGMAEWASPVDGAFADAAAWTPMVVPGPGDTAVLGGAGPYAVRSGTRAVGFVRLTNPQARLVIEAGATFSTDGAAGPGRIVVGDALGADSTATLAPGAGASVGAAIVLNALPGAEARARVAPTGRATILGTISGNGRIEGDLDLGGMVDASMPGHRVEFVDADARLVAPAGRVRAQGGGAIGLEHASVSGGTWDGGDGAELRSVGGVIGEAAIIGSWRVPSGGDITLEGVVSGDGELVINADASDTHDAIVRLGEGAIISCGLVLGAPVGFESRARVERSAAGAAPTLAGIVSGRGRLVGAYTIAGALRPGVGAGGVGVLAADGDVTLTPAARVGITIAGAGADLFDRVTSDGVIAVDGRLEIAFAGGYQPAPDARFEVIRGAGVSGSFSAIVAGPSGPHGPAHVVYTPDAVVVIACAADRDGDGELTLFDFLEFQNQFGVGDPRADLDGDGTLTLFDFLAFQNRFAAGCG